jgi:hypothetical protein
MKRAAASATAAEKDQKEINRAYAVRDLSLDSNKPSPTAQRSSRPPSCQFPSTRISEIKSSLFKPRKNNTTTETTPKSSRSPKTPKISFVQR